MAYSSKQTKWEQIWSRARRLQDAFHRKSLGEIALTRRDVMEACRVSRTASKKIVADFVRDGLLVEHYDPSYGRFGIYEYTIASWVIDAYEQGATR